MGEKIRSFTDLNAWKEGHKLVIMIYEITKKFPKEEIFGLTNQLRRCAVSITSNIAEGFGRQGFKEKIQFYFIARGSVIELQNQILVARDVGYSTNAEFKTIADQSVVAHKLINGLIRSSKENS
ncbi:MAG: four helix bundle protein [bacterium]|nr:four helix bundle protein [bacterium]